jgi:tetratricopeptide (TPR) repeat protein
MDFALAFFMLFCIFVPLILLTLEAFWFWYWFSYGDITHQQLYIIEIVIGTLICLTIAGVLKGGFFYITGFLAIPIPLVIWFLMKQQEEKTDNLNAMLREKAEIARLLEIIDKAKEPALLYKALVELGDLYVKKTEYEKAIGCYRQADEIVEISQTKGLLGLSFKIQQTEKEIRIKKGEIWVCTECSFDNPGNITACKNCGNMRGTGKSVKRDILMQKREIKEDTLNIIFVVVTIIAGLHLLFFLAALMGFLYGHMPWYAAIPLIIVISTLAIFFFLKLIAYVKSTVIPKLFK